MTSHTPVRIIIIGAGNRGAQYARFAADTGLASIVAIAEPVITRRVAAQREHDVPAQDAVVDWHELAAREPFADAVIIATLDADHHEAAVAFLQRGYHVLVEKPMATSEADAAEMVAAAHANDRMLAVCHVMRYTPYTRALARLLASGLLGELVSVDHFEPVGWWHHAHSYVRGNWRREDLGSPMLLAKSVHDIDWLDYVIGRPAKRVSSFGSLQHFRPENRPEGAADNCLDCPVEHTCPYSAPRLYLGALGNPARERWPLSAVTDARTPEGIRDALRTGPYGRCVYASDNDVVDHQVVSIEYEGGTTASFTMSAFSPFGFRKTRIGGTHGYVEGDGRVLNVTDFRTSERHTIETLPEGTNGAAGGHGGGDRGLIDAFVASVVAGEPTHGLASAEDSFRSHQLTWAAERARLEGRVIDLTTSPSLTLRTPLT